MTLNNRKVFNINGLNVNIRSLQHFIKFYQIYTDFKLENKSKTK